MSIFRKSYTMKWWQMGFLKLTLLALGIAIGAFWSEIFVYYLQELILVAAAGTLYLLLTYTKKK